MAKIRQKRTRRLMVQVFPDQTLRSDAIKSKDDESLIYILSHSIAVESLPMQIPGYSHAILNLKFENPKMLQAGQDLSLIGSFVQYDSRKFNKWLLDNEFVEEEKYDYL